MNTLIPPQLVRELMEIPPHLVEKMMDISDDEIIKYFMNSGYEIERNEVTNLEFIGVTQHGSFAHSALCYNENTGNDEKCNVFVNILHGKMIIADF